MSAGAWVRSVQSGGPARKAPWWVWGVALALSLLAGVAVTNLVFAVALLGGGGLLLLIRHIFLRPSDGFVVALGFFPFYTLLRGAALAYHVPIPAAIVGLWPELLLCIMMAGILCQRIRARQKLQVGWDDAWMILLLISTLYGVVLSLLEKDMVAVVYGFHQSVTSLLFFFVARWLAPPPGYLQRLVRVWVISYFILAVLSFLDYAFRPDFIIAISAVMRPDFNLFNPYEFYKWYPRMQALVFAEQFWGTVCAFLALYALIALFNKKTVVSRLLLWATCLVSLAGLVCSMSRGSMVCFVVGVFVLLCFRGPHRRALLAVGVAVSLLSGLLIVQFGSDPRISSFTTRTTALIGMASGGDGMTRTEDGKIDQSSSATNRVVQWEIALNNFPVYPAGRGLGRAGSAAYQHNTSVNREEIVSDGGYFRVLAETGLPGIVCFLIAMAGMMRVLLHRLLRDTTHVTGEDRTLALTLFTFGAGLLAQHIGADVFSFYYIIPLFWFLLGLLLSRREAARRAAQTQNQLAGLIDAPLFAARFKTRVAAFGDEQLIR